MSSLDDWRRPGPTPRQRRIDLVIGLVVVAAALLYVMLARSVGQFVWGVERSAFEHLGFAFAITFPLIWRRSHPDVVLLVTAVVFIVGQVREAQEIQFASGAIFAAIYAEGAWGRDHARARWLRIGVIGAMFGWLAVAWLISVDGIPEDAFADGTGELPPLLSALVSQVLMNVVVFGFSYFFGEIAWLAARREAVLVDQTEQLRLARATAEEQAVVTERLRIARELHDVVAHHVSVMGIQAAAARRAMDRNTETARDSLTAVEESARTAVDELQRMLGALRTADEPVTAPSPGVERVEELLDRVRDAGLTPHFAVYGTAAEVPASTSQTAYRIVQEAVTNALKHAGASTVDVRIRYLARELEIDVADDGRGAVRTTGGMGLIGMRERVALLGGTVEAANRTGDTGGFRVRSRLPLAVPKQRESTEEKVAS
ncbi:sensor histidine kinase [Actinoplanes sp. LDG1-06]|uniref:histidine kinase n=1 Tax=Paractinoplanes ovalisporus TaxID=2810368 RepID=A0ABS2ACU5_9ACTN|nr:sensor histidine kinase [Actinoplanes ovalisporus]MBM2617649.1 sensor histidine kinase [Actinoplanes ovalisporus]